jgi:TPR repeat protein
MAPWHYDDGVKKSSFPTKGITHALVLILFACHAWAEQGEEDPMNPKTAKACCDLARRYQMGDGVPKDSTKALKWYSKSAEQGNTDAQYGLGLCYWKGDGITKNQESAVKWWRKAADNGNAIAQYNIAVCYAKGIGMTKDYTEAVKWWRKAAEQGHAESQVCLGCCYARHDIDFAAFALAAYEPVRYHGDLSECYSSGGGLPVDGKEASIWWRKAAENGNARAQYSIGRSSIIPKNNGECDCTEAVKWYRKAAEQGYANAQLDLAQCYGNGQGVPMDQGEALKWYRKAAEQGDAHTQVQFGWCYIRGGVGLPKPGKGVPLDGTEAAKWFRKAAEQGDPEGQGMLGWCYSKGTGVPLDYTKAVEWSLLSAEQGGTNAQTLLADFYAEGRGVAKDYVKAYMWYKIRDLIIDARIRPIVIHKEDTTLDKLKSKMTPEQIAEAERLSREWKPKKGAPSR